MAVLVLTGQGKEGGGSEDMAGTQEGERAAAEVSGGSASVNWAGEGRAALENLMEKQSQYRI